MTTFTRESGELPRYKGVVLSPRQRKKLGTAVEPRRTDVRADGKVPPPPPSPDKK